MTGLRSPRQYEAVRGRPDGLLPLEHALLEVGLAFQKEGSAEFHGFRAALRLKEARGAPLFATHGALYKALDRLQKRGYLESRWEDPEIAVAEGRPRRKLYRVTAVGATAAAAPPPVSARRFRKAPA
jgi:PadR family transcriptional regulator PadR